MFSTNGPTFLHERRKRVTRRYAFRASPANTCELDTAFKSVGATVAVAPPHLHLRTGAAGANKYCIAQESPGGIADLYNDALNRGYWDKDIYLSCLVSLFGFGLPAAPSLTQYVGVGTTMIYGGFPPYLLPPNSYAADPHMVVWANTVDGTWQLYVDDSNTSQLVNIVGVTPLALDGSRGTRVEIYLKAHKRVQVAIDGVIGLDISVPVLLDQASGTPPHLQAGCMVTSGSNAGGSNEGVFSDLIVDSIGHP